MRNRTIAALATSLAVGFAAADADAAIWQLELTGYFQAGDALNEQGAALDTFGGLTAFSFTAIFDDMGTQYRAGPPNAPLPGYVAYAFSSATLTIDGVTYDVASFADDPDQGVAVALFDPSNVFNPGFYAAGFFGNPLGVGPGVIARFDDASPDFTADALAASTLTDYLGYGAVSGPTVDGGPGNRCQEGQPELCLTVPILLTGPDGRLYDLTLLTGGYDATGAYAFTASLSEVPIPAGFALFATGLAGIAGRRYLKKSERPEREVAS
jgi:hypothetical protein